MSTRAECAVALEGVSFTYPGTDVGVHQVDLGIRRGELLTVIGASGCGKSTLMKVIAGFLTPSKGRVIIGGRDAANIPPRSRNVGLVFQTYALFPHMVAWENVAYPLKLRGRHRTTRRAAALKMLERVGLLAQAEKLPGQLSGGQQQRVALARALVFEPQALLLDEPLSALDAALRVEMRGEITNLQRALSTYGYGIDITGRYDDATKDVVTALQRHFRPARVDGVADPATMQTLEKLIAGKRSAR